MFVQIEKNMLAQSDNFQINSMLQDHERALEGPTVGILEMAWIAHRQSPFEIHSHAGLSWFLLSLENIFFCYFFCFFFSLFLLVAFFIFVFFLCYFLSGILPLCHISYMHCMTERHHQFSSPRNIWSNSFREMLPSPSSSFNVGM